MFAPGWRESALEALGDGFDLLVAGGGITGCGIALDAAQRGLRVLLVERGDLACGTSSRSSKLVHGGLRYLKRMQFRITRLACRERDRMLQLSPHLVRPIRFLYPAYRGARTPGWTVDLGLWMYDRLARTPEPHHHVDADAIHRLAPGLPTEDLDRALLYRDAVTDDARLTLAVAATAAGFGAHVLTRAAVEELPRGGDGRVAGALLRDLETGRTHRVRAHVVVNATGVWCDAVRALAGLPGRRLRPSRGTHLVLRRGRLPLEVAIAVPSPDDGRPVCCIPHPEGVLVGTTDVYHDGSLDDPRPTTAEVDYLLRCLASVFPECPPSRADIVGAFAGLRPILDTHADDPSEASREEGIWEEAGLLTVTGGKLTTWRAMAEEAVDAALRLLPAERAARAAPCATAGTPLAGLVPSGTAPRLAARHRLAPEVARAMVRRLGALAWTACAGAGRRELEPVAPGLDLTRAEARAWARHGAVVHLDDLLLRRVRLGLWDPAAARTAAPALRRTLQRELGWGYRRWREELDRLDAALDAWSPAGVR